MNKKKPFSDKRWHDVPKATVVGRREFTEEERLRADIDFEKILKQYGSMQPDESLDEWKREEGKSEK